MAESLAAQVRARAGGTCEYCRMPDSCDPLPFQVDHVIARQHSGPTCPDNLAWACVACNNHKGPNVAGVDWQGDVSKVVPLFHPRRDQWRDHFRFNGPVIEGLTEVGRATVACLAFNLAHRLAFRAALVAEGVFPPANVDPTFDDLGTHPLDHD